MSKENRNIYRKLFTDYWSGDDEEVLRACVPENSVNHTLHVHGPDEWIEFMKPFRVGLPDFHFIIDHELSDGDFVTFIWRGFGTHKGEFMGVPATFRKVEFNGCCSARIVNGQILEEWSYPDFMGLLQQLQATPTAEPVPN